MLKIPSFKTCDTLPVSQLTENIVYQTHITRFSAVSRAEIADSTGPDNARANRMVMSASELPVHVQPFVGATAS